MTATLNWLFGIELIRRLFELEYMCLTQEKTNFVCNQRVPAVVLPPALKAGFSFARISMDVPGRTPSSLDI